MLESKNKVYQKIMRTGQPIMDLDEIQHNMESLNSSFHVSHTYLLFPIS